MKITIVGLGYVGMSSAQLLARDNDIIAFDVDREKVNEINERSHPNIRASTDKILAYEDAEYIIIAAPTDYDSKKDSLDTEILESIIQDILEINSTALIVIRSTVPIGFTESMKKRFNSDKIIFCPEFLRESQALYDSLHPSRIVIGEDSERAQILAELLTKPAKKKDVPVVYTSSSEAEAIKLFSNSYLAMRIAFFNELDTFADLKGLDTKQIIKGLGLDPRIGDHYNNPSFAYGGACLPKDTKQLLADFDKIPQEMISATATSNERRKAYILERILEEKPSLLGIYRLTDKIKADNFRHSAVLDIIKQIRAAGIEVVIYEPLFDGDYYDNCRIIRNLEEFKRISDIIVANRWSDEIKDVKEKVYTRDIFNKD